MSTPQQVITSKFRTSPYEVVTEGLGYPEGPVYLYDGSVLVTEISTGKLTRVMPNGEKVTVARLGGGPNGAAIGPDGAAYVCNDGGFQFFRLDQALNALAGDGALPAAVAGASAHIMMTGDESADYKGGSIQRVDLKTGQYTTLYSGFINPCRSVLAMASHSLRSPDDLVFDESGGFWFTDWGKTRDRVRDITGVYYAQPDGSSIEEVIFPLSAPNGIALSPDQKRLYVAETYSQRVLYWNLKAPGIIDPNPNSYFGGWVLYAGYPGMLDSMAVDEQGNVYVATLAANGLLPANSGISIVSPDGKFLEFLEIDVMPPDPLPSNICFGGPDMKTAYITLGGTGRLVKCQMAVPGMRLSYK